jgi:HAD superfamily phosphoserine phosphatase-like hydrolase
MPLRLVAFDLDGTLLRGRTVCEGIAARLGHLERMQELERNRERCQIEAAREEMLSWYELHSHSALCADLPGVEIAPGADQAFAFLRARGVRTAIVSITWSFAVAHFARRFGADAFVGTNIDGGRIVHFWPEDKPRWLAAHCASLGWSLADVGAVGDSLGDMPMLDAVGHAVFVGRELPRGCVGIRHAPLADMRLVAEMLVNP